VVSLEPLLAGLRLILFIILDTSSLSLSLSLSSFVPALFVGVNVGQLNRVLLRHVREDLLPRGPFSPALLLLLELELASAVPMSAVFLSFRIVFVLVVIAVAVGDVQSAVPLFVYVAALSEGIWRLLVRRRRQGLALCSSTARIVLLSQSASTASLPPRSLSSSICVT
jgi:hypothetical protein